MPLVPVKKKKKKDPSLNKGNIGSQTLDWGLLPTGVDSYDVRLCFCPAVCLYMHPCVCVCFHYAHAMHRFGHVHVFGVCCVLTKCVLPWHNCTGWLGIKHQVTYYSHAWMFVYSVLSVSLCACVPCYICSHIIVIGSVWNWTKSSLFGACYFWVWIDTFLHQCSL